MEKKKKVITVIMIKNEGKMAVNNVVSFLSTSRVLELQYVKGLFYLSELGNIRCLNVEKKKISSVTAVTARR